uniref:NAD-dependent protein deacylase Regulatory protein SIR2 homolog n=1 Tax=Rhizophora mucronata TaxID=61149 RepID=A0A2P2J6P2_RHIMU
MQRKLTRHLPTPRKLVELGQGVRIFGFGYKQLEWSWMDAMFLFLHLPRLITGSLEAK